MNMTKERIYPMCNVEALVAEWGVTSGIDDDGDHYVELPNDWPKAILKSFREEALREGWFEEEDGAYTAFVLFDYSGNEKWIWCEGLTKKQAHHWIMTGDDEEVEE